MARVNIPLQLFLTVIVDGNTSEIGEQLIQQFRALECLSRMLLCMK